MFLLGNSTIRFSALFLAFGASSAFAAQACSTNETTPVRDAAPPGLVELEASVVDASRMDASDARADVDPCEVSAPSLCSPTATWGTPTPILVGADRRFAAVSADELHLAYYVGASPPDAGVAALLRVSDRSSTADAFVEGVLLGQEVDAKGAAVSANGLLAVVTKNGIPNTVTRPTLGLPFGAPSSQAFDVRGEGDSYRAPVLSVSGGLFLTLGEASVGQLPFTFLSKAGDVYRNEETILPAPELLVRSTENLVPRPTGVSKDLRTLFYFDEATKTEKAAFRAAPGCPYKTFVDLGNRPGAQPNAACTALYYADPDVKTGSNIVRVEKNP